MPLTETQTGAIGIEVGHTKLVILYAGIQDIIEEFIASVRHRATNVFRSSSAEAGSSADAQQS